MTKGLITDTILEDIGDAIRAKLDVQTQYKPGDMAAAINSIPTGSGSSTLPQGYKRLTHVKTTGGAYFDSLLRSSSHFGALFIIKQSSNQRMNIFGAFSEDGTNLLYSVINNNYIDYYPSAAQSSANAVNIGGISEVLYGIGTNVYYSILPDGTTKNYSSIVATDEVPLIMFAFGDSINGQTVIRTSETFVGYIFGVVIYDNGQIVANFVPCINPQNVVGFYDTVRELFFSSEGSSQFIAGIEIPTS